LKSDITKRLVGTFFISASLFVISILTTVISLLKDVTQNNIPSSINFNQLAHGNIFQLLFTRTYWEMFSKLLPINYTVNPPAFILTTIMALIMLLIFIHGKKVNETIGNIFIFALVLIPIVISILALLNSIPERSGLWLAFMINGIIYVLIIDIGHNVISLIKNFGEPDRISEV
jgi:hypothetical protein